MPYKSDYSKGRDPTASILSPETILPNVLYSCSINPCDDNQYFNVDTDRLDKFQTYHQTYTVGNTNAVIKTYIEISKKGRLHMHGTIMFLSHSQILEFFMYDIHRIVKNNTIEIDTIDDNREWGEYCTKSKTLFKTLRKVETTDATIKRHTMRFVNGGVKELKDKPSKKTARPKGTRCRECKMHISLCICPENSSSSGIDD